MKAVKRFKNAIAHGRPPGLDAILGNDTRIVQPPLSISKSEKPPLLHKTRSMDTHDRKQIETALVAEGVHRDVDVDTYQGRTEDREDSAIAFAPAPDPSTRRSQIDRSEKLDPSSPTNAKRNLDANPKAHRPPHAATFPQPSHRHGKGQAHDPLSDHLYLNLGPGESSRPPTPPAVSESPPAAETDIYEAAYRKEVDRIRATQGRSATLFLTRRVEKMEDYVKDQSLIKGDSTTAFKSMSGLSKAIETARTRAAEDSAKGNEKQNTDGEGNSSSNVYASKDDGGLGEGGEELPGKAQGGGLGPFSRLVDQARSLAGKGLGGEKIASAD